MGTGEMLLSLSSCEGTVNIFSLLLSGSKKDAGRSKSNRLRLRILDTIAIDPQTQEVKAYFFTSKDGSVLKKNKRNTSLLEAVQTLLQNVVRWSIEVFLCSHSTSVTSLTGWLTFAFWLRSSSQMTTCHCAFSASFPAETEYA